jgi:isoleucyl-tRNA synthetase
LDLNITDELRQEGLMRELIRNIQQARKEAGLIVDDRIKLFIDDSSEKVKELLTNSNLVEEIKNETLTEVLAKDNKLKFVKKYKLNDQEVELALEKH